MIADDEDEGAWVAEVAHLAGFASKAHARAALHAVLDGLGAMVPHARRRTLAEALPAPLAASLLRRDYDEELGAAWLLEVVSEGEHVRPGSAIEHVQCVLSVLREGLDPDRFRVLVHELPADVAALVPPERSSAPPPPPPAAPSRGHRLADGRPGSEHPIAESVPPSRAQPHSVAASEDPHADTKLSEAQGLTQEREHTELAEARPGPERTLASTED